MFLSTMRSRVNTSRMYLREMVHLRAVKVTYMDHVIVRSVSGHTIGFVNRNIGDNQVQVLTKMLGDAVVQQNSPAQIQSNRVPLKIAEPYAPSPEMLPHKVWLQLLHRLRLRRPFLRPFLRLFARGQYGGISGTIDLRVQSRSRCLGLPSMVASAATFM